MMPFFTECTALFEVRESELKASYVSKRYSFSLD